MIFFVVGIMWFIGVFGYVIFIKGHPAGFRMELLVSLMKQHSILKKGEIRRYFLFPHVQEATFFHIEAHNYL